MHSARTARRARSRLDRLPLHAEAVTAVARGEPSSADAGHVEHHPLLLAVADERFRVRQQRSARHTTQVAAHDHAPRRRPRQVDVVDLERGQPLAASERREWAGAYDDAVHAVDANEPVVHREGQRVAVLVHAETADGLLAQEADALPLRDLEPRCAHGALL